MSIVQVDSFSPHAPQRPDEPPSARRRREFATAAIPSQERRRRPSAFPAAPSETPPPIEIAFLASHGTPLILLQYAGALARRHGVSADKVLIAEGLMSEDNFYRTLAAHIGVWFLEDPALVVDGDASIDEERGYAPLAANEHGLRWAVAPRGAAIARLIDAADGAHSRPLFAIAAPSLIRAALDRDLPQFRAHRAAYSAERANPELSARAASGRKILAIAIGGNAALFACLFSSLAPISLAATLAYAIAFFAAVFLRLFACAASFSEEKQAVRIDEAQLPNYSLIVPLYDEASVVPQLTRAIERLDYPRAKLEVKFVVEHHDDQTTQALRKHPPRVPHEIIVAPPGAPLTKPRALNITTPHLRGDIVAVFDAEDLPEYDQLRKAAAAFAQTPAEVACLQASLAIDNCDNGWIAAFYAMDYAALFEVFNRGVAAMGLPLFLGGTSNHFRGIR